MSSVIISDCSDDNAIARVSARLSAITQDAVTSIRVPAFLDERSAVCAAGNLIDALDAVEGKPGVVIVNVAPRMDTENENGAPFGYFWFGDTLVISTIDGGTLSLVADLGVVESFAKLDVSAVTDELIAQELVPDDVGSDIKNSQFRSYEFAPYVAGAVLGGFQLPVEEGGEEEIDPAPSVVWWVDNFGNIKTTIIDEYIGFTGNGSVPTRIGTFAYEPRLTDVPEGETAVVRGSSGIGDHRFLEIVRQGGSAADTLGVSIGDQLM